VEKPSVFLTVGGLRGRFPHPNLVYTRQEVDEMNDDLERLEALYHDIIAAREKERSDSKMWDCLERLGQEMLVLRLQVETERWHGDDSPSDKLGGRPRSGI